MNTVVEYQDDDGRKWKVAVPSDCPPDMFCSGIPIGPPALAEIAEDHQWPKEFEIRLHNALYNRGIFTRADFEARGRDVLAALQAALKVDLATLHSIYVQ